MNGEAQERLVGEFESPSGGYRWRLNERDNGILVMQAEGTACRDGVVSLLDVLDQFRQSRQDTIRLMTLSAKVKGMEPDARNVAMKMFQKGSPVSMWATVGDSFVMRAFFKLYNVLSHIQMAAFAEEREAVHWLLSKRGQR
jgi:hypothetical protein